MSSTHFSFFDKKDTHIWILRTDSTVYACSERKSLWVCHPCHFSPWELVLGMSSQSSSCLQLLNSPARLIRVVWEEGWTTIICCQEDFTASYFLLKDSECRPSRFILMKCLSLSEQLVQSCCLPRSSNSNVGIRELPTELGQLSNLWQLDIEDLNITNVPQEVRKEGTVPNTHRCGLVYITVCDLV